MVETGTKQWYIVHTYSGFEERVRIGDAHRAQMRVGADGSIVVAVSPHYKLILLSVIAIFAISIVTWIALGMAFEAPTQSQMRVFDGIYTVWTSTLGAILGLLGAKLA